MVQHRQMNKSTVNILNLSKMAVCRIIICFISIEALTNDSMKAHNKFALWIVRYNIIRKVLGIIQIV